MGPKTLDNEKKKKNQSYLMYIFAILLSSRLKVTILVFHWSIIKRELSLVRDILYTVSKQFLSVFGLAHLWRECNPL